MSEWYYAIEGRQHGPVPESDLVRLFAEGGLRRNDYVWAEGMRDWAAFDQVFNDVVRQAEAAGSATQAGGAFSPTAAPSTAVPPPRPAVAGPRLNGLALGSFIVGIIGFGCMGGMGGIVAVILGHIALGQIRQAPGQYTGRGFAIAGLVLGYVQLAILALFVLFFVIAALGPVFLE